MSLVSTEAPHLCGVTVDEASRCTVCGGPVINPGPWRAGCERCGSIFCGPTLMLDRFAICTSCGCRDSEHGKGFLDSIPIIRVFH